MKVKKKCDQEAKKKGGDKVRRSALKKSGVIMDVEGIRVTVGKCRCKFAAPNPKS